MTTMKYAAYTKALAPLRRLRCLWAALACVFLLSACESVNMPSVPWASHSDNTYSAVASVAAVPAGTVSTPVSCLVGHGAVHFSKGWYDFSDASFTLRDGERVNVTLKSKTGGQSAAFQGIYDKAGQKMLFCPVRTGAPGERILCGSIYALEDDLQFGIKRTFDVPDAVMGATISCASDRRRLMKL